MSEEGLSFSTKLTDELSSPAEKMTESLDALEHKLQSINTDKLEKGLAAAGKAASSAQGKIAAASKAVAKPRDIMGESEKRRTKDRDSLKDGGGLGGAFLKIKDATKNFAELRGATGSTGGALKQMAREANLGVRALNKVGEAGSGLVTAAGGIAAGVGVVGTVATGLTIAGGKWALSTLAFKEDTLQSFKTMLGTEEAAQRVFKTATKFAGETPFSTEEVVGGYQKFLTAGFKENELDTLMKAVGDVGANMGTDKMGQVSNAIGQIKAKGKLQGEEMMQLAEAGVGQSAIFKALGTVNGNTKGKSVAEVQKLITGGKVTGDQGIAAVLEAIRVTQSGGTLGGAMQGKSKTLTGLMSSAADIPASLLMDSDSMGALQPLKDDIAGVIKAFTVGEPLYKRGVDMFDRVGKAWGRAFGAMGDGSVIENFLGATIDGIGNLGASMAPLAEGFLPEMAKQFTEVMGGGNAVDLKEQGRQLAEVLGLAAKGAIALKDSLFWLVDEAKAAGDVAYAITPGTGEGEGDKFLAENARRGGRWAPGEQATWQAQQDDQNTATASVAESDGGDMSWSREGAPSIFDRDGLIGSMWDHGDSLPGAASNKPGNTTSVNAPIAPGAIIIQVGPDGAGAGEQVGQSVLGNLTNAFGQAAHEAGG